MTEGAFKVAVHRARERFRETLRRRIGETVPTEGEVEEEYLHLLQAVRTGGT
jgi:RNA polymerase sigma-70 factor (ECF subfamily)